MKKTIFGLNLILLLSIFSFAQKQGKAPDELYNSEKQSDSATRKNKKDGNKEISSGSLLTGETTLEAQLQKTLDVKNAQVGDSVILKASQTIEQNGEVIVPKGAKLIGRVTEVQEKTKNNAISKLGIVFDRIEGKNLNAPVSATIISVVQTTSSATVGDVFNSDMSAGSTSSGSVSSGGSSSGGLLGGVGNTVGGVVNTATGTVGSVANTAGQTLSGSTQTINRTLGGLQISQSVSGSANGSSTISAANKNLRLEKGTTFRLQLSN